MKKWIALILALLLCLSAAACGQSSSGNAPAAQPAEQAAQQQPEKEVHQIGVIVYNPGDEEVISFREYLQGYIETNFEMLRFVYSGAITSPEEEMAFIKNACENGAEGFLSFRTFDLAAEVALCEQYKAYYMLASGTVTDEEFEAVADNPYFLGVFGPGREAEYEAAHAMAEHFVNEHQPKRFFILSGGAASGNEMHFQRTLAILDVLLKQPGVNFTGSVDKFARSEKLNSYTVADVTITICPGYVARDPSAFNTAKDALSTGGYDVALCVLPPVDLANYLGSAVLGVVDSFNTRNLQLFNSKKMDYVVGKYSSSVGPAAMLMLNAVTGHAEDFRDNGRAVQVVQGFWVAEGMEDYVEKFSLATSASMNAYNFQDLAQICRLYNPNATLEDLVALAEACSYEDVVARRSE